MGLNQKKKTILNMGGPGTGGGLWTYGSGKKKPGNKGGLFGLGKKTITDADGLSTYSKKEPSITGGVSTFGKKETSSRGSSASIGKKDTTSRDVSSSIFGIGKKTKKTSFTLPKKEFTSSGSDGLDALRLALRNDGKDLKSALSKSSGGSGGGGVTGGDSIFGAGAGGAGGRGKADLAEDSCEFGGKGVCSG